MRTFDADEATRLNCEPWMLNLLNLNPSYVYWGPHEDYMWVKGEGWNSPISYDDWSAFSITLNELNEVVNFYFECGRDRENCSACGGSGVHRDAQWIDRSFYSHSSPFKSPTPREQQSHALLDSFAGPGGYGGPVDVLGHGAFPSEETLAKYGAEFRAFCEHMREVHYWCELLDASDRAALSAAGRRHDGGLLGHDAINRHVLVEARCERYGVPHTCDVCDGHGDAFTDPAGHVGLVLWLLHPRKGASRGVEIKRLNQADLPAVFSFLREAAQRNAERFAKVVGL